MLRCLHMTKGADMTATATQPTGYAPALLFRVLTRAQYFGRDANLPALVR